jgi:sigma-B regulation protein RsbU (phosphoserine phosphatase)
MSERILLVDDEADLRTVLRLTLRRAGFDVVEARDGLDALERVAEALPDAILLDVMMPRLDGLETLSRLRREPRTASLPVILLTARTQVADRVAGLDRGADDYVAKPFEPAEIVARLRSLLRRTEPIRLTTPLLARLGTWGSAEGLAQLGRDLQTAAEIQTRLLPEVPPSVAGVECAAVLRPSMVVGGDFFDFVPMGASVGVAIGDVCGKGISAALLMVMVRTLLRHVAVEGDDPARVLTALNLALCRDLPASLFVTLTLATADPRRPGHLRVASAGHPPAVVLPAEATATLAAAGGLPLGVLEDATFETVDVDLGHGDALVLYTDGVIDTVADEGERPGVAGLVRSIEQLRDGDAGALLHALVDEVERRAAGRMRDDVAIVVLRRPPASTG